MRTRKSNRTGRSKSTPTVGARGITRLTADASVRRYPVVRGTPADQTNGSAIGHGPDRESVIAQIRSQLARSAETGVPKHVTVRSAILASIKDNSLKPGDQLPPEQSLAAGLGVSLGTVRQALGQLAIDGTVTRQHGHGTFVAKPPRTVDDMWHFRFYDEDGRTLLPVYSHIAERELIRTPGSWTKELGEDLEGYIRIARRFNIGNRFLCYSRFYLSASRFREMLDLSISELDSVNLKRILNDRFGAPTLYVSQRVRAERASKTIADALSMSHKSFGMALEVVGYTFNNLPISYQYIWVPATKYMLDLSLHTHRDVASVRVP